MQEKSGVNENWVYENEIEQYFALHYKTGKMQWKLFSKKIPQIVSSLGLLTSAFLMKTDGFVTNFSKNYGC